MEDVETSHGVEVEDQPSLQVIHHHKSCRTANGMRASCRNNRPHTTSLPSLTDASPHDEKSYQKNEMDQ